MWEILNAAKMMLRASAAGGRKLLTIMDGSGAYFGKVSVEPEGIGVILHHKQSPCCQIKTTDAWMRDAG